MEIRSDLAFPARSNAGAPVKYPEFRKMEIGDSVFYPGVTSTLKNKQYIAANQYGRQSGKRFAGRIQDGGLRIWRVE